MKELDWNHLRAFHATADCGSLSAAAVQLGLTQPTLSRQVKALEDDLDVNLFERSGRRLVMTQTGRDLLEHIVKMRKAADVAVLTASGKNQELTGRVSISATDSISTYVLPEMLGRIRAAAPGLTIEIVSSNNISDLHQMEADIAIRHSPPGSSDISGRHIRDSEAYFYASQDWLTRNAEPESVADLATAGLIGFDDVERLAGHYRAMGIPIDGADFRLVSSSAVVVWEMVKRGLGIAAMLNEVACNTAGVVRLLPDTEPVQVPLWLVTPKELSASPRIRLVTDILVEEFAKLG